MASTSLVSRCLCLLLLLLLLAVAGNTVAVTTPGPHGHGNGAARAAVQMPPKYYDDDAAVVGRGAAGVTTVPPADDDDGCWESVVGTSPPCARDVLLSLALHAPRLSGECCTVLARAGDKCVAGVFSGLPSGEKYLPLVKPRCEMHGQWQEVSVARGTPAQEAPRLWVAGAESRWQHAEIGRRGASV
uniref:Prolamin-like domain-containing protein n=1 Tax=Oryza sativa subsp. japonica TaxID=39947 RepID=Q9XGR1_ORYSJ|nr:hypothetical protein [Oryza sativa Japonica Group]BAD10127.1 hypothetical protein [Oryza sativa Japonica Group]